MGALQWSRVAGEVNGHFGIPAAPSGETAPRPFMVSQITDNQRRMAAALVEMATVVDEMAGLLPGGEVAAASVPATPPDWSAAEQAALNTWVRGGGDPADTAPMMDAVRAALRVSPAAELEALRNILTAHHNASDEWDEYDVIGDDGYLWMVHERCGTPVKQVEAGTDLAELNFDAADHTCNCTAPPA